MLHRARLIRRTSGFDLEGVLEAYNQRMQWFADTQYGMFIHFGGYSQLGVVQDKAREILRRTAELLKEKPIKKKVPTIDSVPGIVEKKPKTKKTNIDGS